jgi:hypothetical protein
MKSKLLQKKSYGVKQSGEVVDGQQETSKIRPCHGGGMRPHPIPSTRRLTPRPAGSFLAC